MFATETVVNIAICHRVALREGKPSELFEVILSRYVAFAKETIQSHRGEIWTMNGDAIIGVFLSPEKAITGCIEFLSQVLDLNRSESLKDAPLFVRIGVELNDEVSIQGMAESERIGYSCRVLQDVGLLQEACPIGGIAISPKVYEYLGEYQSLFRPTPHDPFLVLQKRTRFPQEETLVRSFLERQKKALPAFCFLTWERIRPNHTLKDLPQILTSKSVVVLGDTSSASRGPLASAATSDAVGLMEALAVLTHEDLRVGIDEWQDTADLVAARNVVIVGSGSSNIYALALNDIFAPLRFVTSDGRSLDTIVAGRKDQEIWFGRHFTLPEHSGLLITSKSVFNPEKAIVWMAGITGMATQAVAAFLKDVLKGQATIDDRAIGCVVGPKVTTRLKVDVSDYYRKWRISDYEVLLSVDKDGNIIK